MISCEGRAAPPSPPLRAGDGQLEGVAARARDQLPLHPLLAARALHQQHPDRLQLLPLDHLQPRLVRRARPPPSRRSVLLRVHTLRADAVSPSPLSSAADSARLCSLARARAQWWATLVSERAGRGQVRAFRVALDRPTRNIAPRSRVSVCRLFSGLRSYLLQLLYSLKRHTHARHTPSASRERL